MQIKVFFLAVTMALAALCMASDATVEKRNPVERQPTLGKRRLTDAEEKIKRNQYSPTKRTEGNTKRAQLYGRTFNWPPSHGGGHPHHPSPQPPVQCKGDHFDKCDISAANTNGFTVSTLTSSGWHKPECCKTGYTCKQFGHWKQGFCVRDQKDEDDCKKDIIKHVLLTKEQIFDYFWSKKIGH